MLLHIVYACFLHFQHLNLFPLCGGNCLVCQLVNYSLENLYLSTCHTDTIHFELAVRSIVSKMLSSFRRCVNFSAEIYRGRFSY